MRDCTAVAAYHNNTVFRLTAITKEGNFVDLVTPDKPLTGYDTFNDLYADVIDTLKINGFQPKFYFSFGREWFNILWYDTNFPTYHQKFGFNSSIIKTRRGIIK